MSTDMDNSCAQIREELDIDSLTAGEIETLLSHGHFADCEDCTSWLESSGELIAVARAAPQFDVPEKLTQDILSTVEKERVAQRKQFTTTIGTVMAIAFAWILLYVDSLETIWGIASWSIGLLCMIGFKYLIQDPERRSA